MKNIILLPMILVLCILAMTIVIPFLFVAWVVEGRGRIFSAYDMG